MKGLNTRMINVKATFTLLTIIAVLGITSCSNERIIGMGPVETHELSLASFESISFEVPGNVTITQGETQEVWVSGQANIIEQLQTNIADQTWRIAFADNASYQYDDLDILITVPSLRNAMLAGVGRMDIEPFEDAIDKSLILAGSGNIYVDQFNGLNEMDVRIDGSGSIYIQEQCSPISSVDVSIVGSGDFHGFKLPTETCKISILGSGDAEVSVSSQLDVVVEGSGVVYYKGAPQISVNVTGSGGVKSSN